MDVKRRNPCKSVQSVKSVFHFVIKIEDMKLRLEGNSIRLRVRKSDLSQLTTSGWLTETLVFPNNNVFKYQLKTEENAATINAQMSAGALTVSIPLSIATLWAASETVSLEHTLDSGLYILIEKDFPCKDRANEDKNDTFFELIQTPIQC
jgi:hypothetical protein